MDNNIQKLYEENAQLKNQLQFSNSVIQKLSNEIGTLKTNQLIFELNSKNTNETYKTEIERLNMENKELKESLVENEV